MTTSDTASPTTAALRGASAAVICLMLSEWFQLADPGLAVWSTHMVLVQYTFTSFQKGVERFAGRALGIFVAICFATLTRNTPWLGIGLEFLAIVPLFYVFFANRLAYTCLNAGLYLAAMMQLARTHPDLVLIKGSELFNAVMLGVCVAVVVAWVTRSESELKIHTEGEPLFPINRDRLVHSVMLALTVGAVHCASFFFALSPTTAMVSVMVLTITPDFQSLLHKGELRLAGAGLAVAFASLSILLLMRQPNLLLLALLVFLGIFMAVKLARSSANWGYAGVQMGLVLPMILVVPQAEFGSLEGAWSRIGGVLLAIAASIIIGVTWGAIAPAPPLPFTPTIAPPAPPATDNTATR